MFNTPSNTKLKRIMSEVPRRVTIPAALLWQRVDRVDFGHWIQSNADEVMKFAQDNWEAFSARPKDKPLRFMYQGHESNVDKSNITFMKPLFNLQTLTNEDVQTAVDRFYRDYMEGSDRVCAIISGDFQVWIKLWKLHLNNPTKYNWLIPVPGEWHWTWHILQALFKMFYRTIFAPFAKHLGFKKLDEKAKVFHYAEDLLEMVTNAICTWIERSMANVEDMNAVEWLHSIRKNHPGYKLAYACIHYFIPYWSVCSALKWNKSQDMLLWWRHFTHLFFAAGKTNYTMMSVRFLWELHSLNPEVREIYDQHRVLSFSSEEGTGIPFDGVIELVRISVHTINGDVLMIHCREICTPRL